MLGEALSTIDGSSLGRLERYFALLSAVRTNGLRHFTGAAEVPGTAEISVSSIIIHWIAHADRNTACRGMGG